ncbi:MAG: site-specific recombinase [Candidatus Kapabacteria bacterium]|nr:site-specific recombinase [Candidatus Kapabacteria bacterium]
MFQALLQSLAKDPTTTNPQYLVDIVAILRPSRMTFNKNAIAEQRLRQLLAMLQEYQPFREALSAYIERLLNNSSHLSLYAESGVQSQHGFFSEAFQKITHLILPPAHNADTLRGIINLVFDDNSDHEWFCALPDAMLVELLEMLGFATPNSTVDIFTGTYNKLLNAVLVLSHKLAAMGTESDVIVRLPKASDEEHSIVEKSLPFLEQSRELVRYVERIRANNTAPSKADSSDAQHALVMLSQCEDCIEYIRRHRHSSGASLSLTYQIQRIVQHIERLRSLIYLTFSPTVDEPHELQSAIVRLWKETVEAEDTDHSLIKHYAHNTALLTFQIVENAAKTGEHYITTTRKEFIAFFTSSMGGGLIVAFMTCIKLWVTYRHLPPFGEALLYSLNYSIGFMLIHIVGFKLATKQPAMTASAIAESLDVRRKSVSSGEISLQNLVETIAKVSRSQLASFAGNVVVSFPVACVLAALYYLLTTSPMADVAKAHKMINELHPFLSLSLIHAGIAGVFLFLSGLISGYYDNSVVFNNIPERLRQHPVLRRMLSKPKLEGFANYVENNLGALAGNFFFGFMLGTASTIGFIVGLPFDIRHITFAAASFAIALVSLFVNGETVSTGTVLWTVLGIVGIGAMNFLVSFSLALFVAVRSRNVNFRQSAELVSLLGKYFRSNTRDFFFPPKNSHAKNPQSAA